MRNGSCTKCGMADWYVKGKFSYCRPCHAEAQKRYAQRKSMGESVDTVAAPNSTLSKLLKSASSSLTCAAGHLMTGDNVVLSSQRQGRHLRRRCRTCERNAKRVTYGLAPEPAPTRLAELF